MKKLKISVFFVLLLVTIISFDSCKDFLDPNPESTYTTKTFYTSQNDFELAISAVYSLQQNMFDGQYGLLHFLIARSDDSNHVNTNLYADNAELFSDNAECGPTDSVWVNCYRMISRSNSILTKIDNVDFSDTDMKQYIKGEAYAMRGWAYETLGEFFGGVPLLVDKEYTVSEVRKIPRSTRDSTFVQAINDYKKAIDLLPVSWKSNDAGRVTKYAVAAVLGRLYMFMREPAKARMYLEQVINSGIYSMAPEYANCFTDKYDNDPKEDRVWEVQYIGGQTGEGQEFSEDMMPEESGVTEGYAIKGSSAAMQVSSDLLSKYEDGDTRKSFSASNSISGSRAQGYSWCTKWSHYEYKPQANNDWANNLPIIRYTDVLMLDAEAINATDGPTSTAIGYINKVRERAGLADLTSDQTSSQSDFLKAIKHERRIEFMFEGSRWFDLVRWNDFISVMKAFFTESDENNGMYVNNVTSNRAIFAIPQEELDRYHNTSIMWQNPEY